jgi:BirA family transcriptional regulator, biotin operon repressor / biotin---[acetyl-CoA-carboxylase] ligase
VKSALITPQNPWRAVDVHASIDSTNLEALRAPRPWRVVVADHQSAGRGRLSRRWEAPPGASVAVSCVVPMPVDRTAGLGWLPLLAGMAMRQALADVADVQCRLKWPNDVMAQESVDDPDAPWLKISGILCEMVPVSGQVVGAGSVPGAGSAPAAGLVVIGAGLNIDQTRDELPVETATSLALCGVDDVRREDLVVRYLGAVADLHKAWAGGGAELDALRAAYRSACLTIGLDVDVHQPDGLVAHGTATGVDDSGRLVVAGPGSPTAHAAGDVTHVRRSQPGAGGTA